MSEKCYRQIHLAVLIGDQACEESPEQLQEVVCIAFYHIDRVKTASYSLSQCPHWGSLPLPLSGKFNRREG